MEIVRDIEKIQTIYINLDDSGKLSRNENVCVYGGTVFFSKYEKDKFITQYRAIVNDIKCKYCNQCIENGCNKKCPELKSYNLKPKDKRRILNYIKRYYTIGCIINNNDIFDYIIDDKASKGRFLDYSLKRLIKEVINNLIDTNKINPSLPVKLIINIDEQSTKSNGYYNLKEGIIEELIHGVYNFNYGIKYSPILFNSLDVKLVYQHSNKSYVVQAADLIAGAIRYNFIKNNFNKDEFINSMFVLDFYVFLP